MRLDPVKSLRYAIQNDDPKISVPDDVGISLSDDVISFSSSGKLREGVKFRWGDLDCHGVNFYPLSRRILLYTVGNIIHIRIFFLNTITKKAQKFNRNQRIRR